MSSREIFRRHGKIHFGHRCCDCSDPRNLDRFLIGVFRARFPAGHARSAYLRGNDPIGKVSALCRRMTSDLAGRAERSSQRTTLSAALRLLASEIGIFPMFQRRTLNTLRQADLARDNISRAALVTNKPHPRFRRIFIDDLVCTYVGYMPESTAFQKMRRNSGYTST